VSYLDTILQVTKNGMSGGYAYKLSVSTPVFVECYKASQYPDHAKSYYSRSQSAAWVQRHSAKYQLQRN
jgi:hypothetical protein